MLSAYDAKLRSFKWNMFRFLDLEKIIATRNSLSSSVRQREKQDRIGDMKLKFTTMLMDLEKKSLIQLSQAARSVNRKQIALNSILRAQKLEDEATFDIVNEFSHVLWQQGEQKVAIQQLLSFVDKDPAFRSRTNDIYDNLRKAETLVQLVSLGLLREVTNSVCLIGRMGCGSMLRKV